MRLLHVHTSLLTEACSPQFDTHLLPEHHCQLSNHAPAVMLNVPEDGKYVTENAHLHMYGKIEVKHNRKIKDPV